MSASFGWRPIDKRAISFRERFTNGHLATIKRIFGDKCILKREDVVRLRTWADFSEDKLWDELADLADENGEIQIVIEY